MDALSNIRARRAQIANFRLELDKEDAELAMAEKVVSRLEATKPNGSDGVPSLRRVRLRPTNRDLVVATLKAVDDPWVETSAELHRKIKEIHGVSMNFAGTLLPMLSSMKDKEIVRDGPKIALAERVRDH